eukprot:CAMPEP_0195523310 /NCGR_PEP_ID=MMETSP0794_2-20130614/22316_1 /TAXON_ID=515487 /ORGANISM="Stephanopyxis turris, Strain CCMP 815" /LENGTH=243 /DNA_ID=CAMNT_0040653279 /DNA_START=17 /DNA_END=748 /DNA_ORIENTATION=+
MSILIHLFILASLPLASAAAFALPKSQFGSVGRLGLEPIETRQRSKKHHQSSFAPLNNRIIRWSSRNNSEDNDNEKNTITVALTNAINQNDDMREALANHPALSMLGVNLNLIELPCVSNTTTTAISNNQLSSIKEGLIDISCFESISAVNSWLRNIDLIFDSVNATEDEKRALGNGNVVAVCFDCDTAKRCLESGRWESQSIYYSTNEFTQGLQGYADSAMHALGDVRETKFWSSSDGQSGW